MEKELKVPVAILDACCELCAHSCSRKPYKTHLECYEEDTRPKRPKGFLGALKWLWNPNRFRSEHPYDDDDKFFSFERWDQRELADRKNNVICALHPEHREVNKSHYCGQFKTKTTIGDERI